MGNKDKRIDAYIEKAEPFARPILKKIRSVFQKGCPGVEEDIKWGAPSFQYKGMPGGMATAVEWLAEGKSRNWKYENC